ncbi:MAG TPA: ABC transporter permease [Ilumatobacter sp.]|nr:ABC transporter permease [Ilumatobacter sp.]
MLTYSAKRLIGLLPLLALISLGAFVLTYLTPGDAAIVIAGESASPERLSEIREQLGLDQPLIEQFFRWLGNAVRGDFGRSLVIDRDVSELISARLGPTVSLVLAGMTVAALIGIPAGLVAGRRPGTLVDRGVTFIATLGIAIPSFWLATILISTFAVQHRIFPAIGYVSPFDDPVAWMHRMVLPAIAIGAASAAEVARQTRSAVSDVVQLDHVRTSRSLGVTDRRIMWKHVLKNAAIPIVTVLGLQIGRLLASGVVIELMFGIPGLGSLAVNSVGARDIPTIQGIVVVVALFVLLTNLVVDLSYAVLNPKVRYQ